MEQQQQQQQKNSIPIPSLPSYSASFSSSAPTPPVPSLTVVSDLSFRSKGKASGYTPEQLVRKRIASAEYRERVKAGQVVNRLGPKSKTPSSGHSEFLPFIPQPEPTTPVSLLITGFAEMNPPSIGPSREDHVPAVSSPLNPATNVKEEPGRAPRTKKESLKKREAKGGDRSTPDVKPATTGKGKKAEPAPIIIGDVIPSRYKLPPPKPADFEPVLPPVMTPHHSIPHPDGGIIEFMEVNDSVQNKRGYRYVPAIADPTFPHSLQYRQTETVPLKARFAFEDLSGSMFVDETGCHVTEPGGYKSARANVCVREGRHYFEITVTNGIAPDGTFDRQRARPHVRLGWGRREAPLEVNVGYDLYSYGIRDVGGYKCHMAQSSPYFPEGEDVRIGDVIGMEINLPSLALHQKVVQGHPSMKTYMQDFEKSGSVSTESAIFNTNVVRDRVPIRFKNHLYFEHIDYQQTKEMKDQIHGYRQTARGPEMITEQPNLFHSNPSLRTLPHSSIKFYKNGRDMGTAFTDLLAFLPPASTQSAIGSAPRDSVDDGMLGYYPQVSAFYGGAVSINPGPDFQHPPPDMVMSGSDSREKDKDKGKGKGKGKSAAVDATSALGPLVPLSDRYEEQIVEDIVYDVIDEVTHWANDGGKLSAVSGESVGRAGSAVPAGDGEIKELVQDDE